MSAEVKKRKARDTSAKRQTILDGAVKVFIKNGFEASSMDRIAEISGVSKRTVYNHFESKEILFQAIVREFLIEREAIKPIEYTTGFSLNEQLKKFVMADLFLVNDPIRRGLSRLLTSTFLTNIEFGKTTYSQNKSFARDSLVEWLNAAKADNKLTFESAELTAKIFSGMVEGCLTWPALMSDGESLKYIDPLLDEIIEAFLSRYQNIKR